MKLAGRIFSSFLGIIVFSSGVSTAVGAFLVSRAIQSEALARVQGDMKAAQASLADTLHELRITSGLLAAGVLDKAPAVSRPDLLFLSSRPDEGVLESAGVDAAPDGGFALLPVPFVLNRLPASSPAQKAVFPGGEALVLYATARGPAGLAFAGIILNGAAAVVERLQDILFGRQTYGKKPFGTVTLFQGETRVATTVVGPTGVLAVGTRVSEAVRKKVLTEGTPWLEPAYVVDDWYFSAYEPLRDPRDRPVGIIYVGVLQRWYGDVRSRAILVLAAVNLPSLALLLAAAYLLARSVVRPITALSRAAGRLAAGESHAPVTAAGGAAELLSLAAAFNEMSREVRDREEELRSRNLALEESTRDYRELLGFVTHELNNSVGSLLLNATVLSDGTMGRMEPDQAETAVQIVRDLERFRDMVRNYLNLSRLQKGTLDFSPQPLDIRSLVIEPVLRRLSASIEHSGLQVRWDWPPEAQVRADRELLDIAVGNLVVNAIKYGREWIRFSFHREEGMVSIGVSNGGPPIPPDRIAFLFRKFSRLSDSGDGAGLGLFLVRTIAERHGGRVSCDVGASTTFHILLPEPASPPPREGSLPEGSPRSPP